MSYWPGDGATNSTVMGSPAGIRASIFRAGIENPCTTSFDRITSRTDSPAVTCIVAGSKAYWLGDNLDIVHGLISGGRVRRHDRRHPLSRHATTAGVFDACR
jgi:hypothetical protein